MRTLFIDIETTPNIVLSWRIGSKVNLSYDSILEERKIICICYKFSDENKVHSLTYNLKTRCDKSMLKKIIKVINKADEVVGHNGDAYDLKFINVRLAYHNLPPLPKVATTDTLKQSRRVFYANSHKLDYLSQFFKLGKKVSTGGYQLWKDVFIEKCPKALKRMVKYCEGDVLLLEKMYKKLCKYTEPGLNKGRAINGTILSCTNCGSKNVKRDGYYISKSGIKYQRYECRNCNSRGKTAIKKNAQK